MYTTIMSHLIIRFFLVVSLVLVYVSISEGEIAAAVLSISLFLFNLGSAVYLGKPNVK